MNKLSAVQSSQIVSKSRSPRRSAPHTLQRFLLSLDDPEDIVRPRTKVSSVLLRPLESSVSLPSTPSASAAVCATLSASRAASSASGESGMVSRLDMLGLRDRTEVGVDGIDDKLPP